MNYPSVPSVAGYLLAGGASRRMGRDKALIEVEGEVLLVRIGRLLERVSSPVHVLAPRGRYEGLGFPVLEDRRAGCGPLGGIESALLHCPHEWALIVACDLPNVDEDWLKTLIAAASPGLAIVASGEPLNALAALWNRSALPAVQAALDAGRFRVRDLLEQLPAQRLVPPRPEILANWNEPLDITGG